MLIYFNSIFMKKAKANDYNFNRKFKDLLKIYPITEGLLMDVKEKPRNVSVQFSGKIQNQAIDGMKEYKKITYLVKSSSRFFLKPDIGEVFDQIHFEDLWGDGIKAICIEEGELLLLVTEGEHFIMQATLLS